MTGEDLEMKLAELHELVEQAFGLIAELGERVIKEIDEQRELNLKLAEGLVNLRARFDALDEHLGVDYAEVQYRLRGNPFGGGI